MWEFEGVGWEGGGEEWACGGIAQRVRWRCGDGFYGVVDEGGR